MTKDVILNLNPESDFGLEGKITYSEDGKIWVNLVDDELQFFFNDSMEDLKSLNEKINHILKLIKDNNLNCPCKPAKEINQLNDKKNDKVKRRSKKD